MLLPMLAIVKSVRTAVRAAVGNLVTPAEADVTGLEAHVAMPPRTSFDNVRIRHLVATVNAKPKVRVAIGTEMSEATAVVEGVLAEKITRNVTRSVMEVQAASAIETVVVNLEVDTRLLGMRSLRTVNLLVNPCGMVVDNVLRLHHLPRLGYLLMANRELRGVVIDVMTIGDVIVVGIERGDVAEKRAGKVRPRDLGGKVNRDGTFIFFCGNAAFTLSWLGVVGGVVFCSLLSFQLLS
jgi:hypothetical protein